MTHSSQTDIFKQVLSTIRQHDLCHQSDRLIVAVSGGADSVALLDLLVSLPNFPLQLVVAHLNHQLRGAESDTDEAFVRDLSTQYNLPCEVAHSNIQEVSRQTGRSLEEAGREARYAFFEKLRQRCQAVAIAVAHHADDQAETFLLRLLRGAGSTGLAAMAPTNQNKIIRPLLKITRQELRNYLAAHNLTFREDASNMDQTFLRNRIRHELLPLLDNYSPGICGRLAATADLIGEDEELLASFTAATFKQLSETGPNWAAMPRFELTQQSRALRLRLFRAAITAVLGDLKCFDRQHLTLLENLLLEQKTGARLNLPRGLSALLTAEQIVFAQHELLQVAPPYSCVIDGPGTIDLCNGLALIVEHMQPPVSWKEIPSSTTYVDLDQAPFPWHVRPVTPGERLNLLGMEGSRAIQDILTDMKFPRHLRPCLPLICHNDHPLWLAGIRRTRHALIKVEQKQAVRITLSGHEQIALFP
jgi:tRNA(Ile)-lysidine synthase